MCSVYRVVASELALVQEGKRIRVQKDVVSVLDENDAVQIEFHRNAMFNIGSVHAEIRFEYLLPNVEPEQYSIGFDQQKEMEAQLGLLVKPETEGGHPLIGQLPVPLKYETLDKLNSFLEKTITYSGSPYLSGVAEKELVQLVGVDDEKYMLELLRVFDTHVDLEDMDTVVKILEIVVKIVQLKSERIIGILLGDVVFPQVIRLFGYNPALIRVVEYKTAAVEDWIRVFPCSVREIESHVHAAYRVNVLHTQISLLQGIPDGTRDFLLSLKNRHYTQVLRYMYEQDAVMEKILEGLEKDGEECLKVLMHYFFVRYELDKTYQPVQQMPTTAASEYAPPYGLFIAKLARDGRLFEAFARIVGKKQKGYKRVLQILFHMTDSICDIDDLMHTKHLLGHQNFPLQTDKNKPLTWRKGDSLLTALIALLVPESDENVECVVDVFKALLNQGAPVNSNSDAFINMFHAQYFKWLIRPLTSLCEKLVSTGELNSHEIRLYSQLVELLAFCLPSHKHRTRQLCREHDLFQVVYAGIDSKHKELVIAGIHFIKLALTCEDNVYYRTMKSKDLFAPLMRIIISAKATDAIGIIESRIFGLMSILLMKNVNLLIEYICNKWQSNFHKIRNSELVMHFSTRMQQLQKGNDGPPGNAIEAAPVIGNHTSNKREAQNTLEEDYFSTDDDAVSTPLPVNDTECNLALPVRPKKEEEESLVLPTVNKNKKLKTKFRKISWQKSDRHSQSSKRTTS